MEIKPGSGLSHNPNRKQRASRKWDETLLLKALPSDVLSVAVLYSLRCYSHSTHMFLFLSTAYAVKHGPGMAHTGKGHEFGNML